MMCTLFILVENQKTTETRQWSARLLKNSNGVFSFFMLKLPRQRLPDSDGSLSAKPTPRFSVLTTDGNLPWGETTSHAPPKIGRIVGYRWSTRRLAKRLY